jgi:hypothetical protein
MTSRLWLFLALALSFGTVHAADEKGDCAISYTRTACPGKETASYSKCDGKQSCTNTCKPVLLRHARTQH